MALTALAVCLGVFLSWRTNGSEASAILAVARAAHVEHAPEGYRHPIGRTSPTAFAEETETKDKLPANARLFTALLLGFYFGTTPWWRNLTASALPRPRGPSPAPCEIYSIVCFLQRRSVATLSGVFRL